MSYLSNRFLRTKINSTFSTWAKLLSGVPQGSVLGPLLFNIYINDFLKETEPCDIAEDNTPFACGLDIESVIARLERDALSCLIWFENNYMKLNVDKCHFLLAGYKHDHLWIKVGDCKIWESTSEKLLDALNDRSLKFDTHVLKLCKKVGQKVTILSRITKYMSLQKRRIVLKYFIESQFSYCPLIWMFHGRITNNKINHIHERALRLTYNDYTSTFEELLDKYGSFSIHHRNTQSLTIELYKSKHGESPEILQNILINRDFCGENLRCKSMYILGMILFKH